MPENFEKEKQLDWVQAFAHFCEVKKQYQQLAGMPGVNTSLALEHVFRPLAERFDRGERSQELYDAMTACG